jgi:ABC-type polysaccharide/polyol phosphate export permease
MIEPATGARTAQTHISPAPDSYSFWFRQLAGHRATLLMLTRKDFQTRYKRASLGILWGVALPALQATIMAVVFSHVVKIGSTSHFPVYVISGVVVYTYATMALSPAATAIADNSGLAERVWFPRAVLVIVPCLSSLVGLLTSTAVLVVIIPLFDVHYTLSTILLLPAAALLVSFIVALSLVSGALHVYFRDVRFLVQAGLLVWIYLTPILYPESLLGRFQWLVECNPLTGIVGLFHEAALGQPGPSGLELGVSLGATAALLLAAVEIYRRCDRLFVDQL